MKRLLLLAAAASALATSAIAADAPITNLPLTASGVTYNECTYTPSGGAFQLCAFMKGWGYGDSTPTSHSWWVDGLGEGHVSVDLVGSPVSTSNPLPVVVTGGGGGGGGGAVTAVVNAYAAGSIVDLGTGSTPAANTVNANLAKINTTLGTPLQANGAVTISNSPTVNLGTLNGAATAAGQVNIVSALAPAGGGGMPVAQADQQATVTGASIGAVGGLTAIPLTAGRGDVGVSTQGIAGSGATLQVQAQNYVGGPWAPVACIVPQTGQNLASFSSDVTCSVGAAGHDSLRFYVLTAATSPSATMSYGYTATASERVTTDINGAQIAANTAPGGPGTLALISTPATNGSPLPTGAKGTAIYLNSGDSLTVSFESASVCGVSAPAATVTLQGPTIDQEALTGVVACVIAKSGSPAARAE